MLGIFKRLISGNMDCPSYNDLHDDAIDGPRLGAKVEVSRLPPLPESAPELGDLLVSMTARYGKEKLLPEAATRDLFKDASPELVARVSPTELRRIGFMAEFMVDANAHLNPALMQEVGREGLITRFAHNMLRQKAESGAA